MRPSKLSAVLLSCGLVGACSEGGSDTDTDTDVDAAVKLGPDATLVEWKFQGVFGVPNLDDDDGSMNDWMQPPFATDDDFSRLVLPQATLAAVPEGGSVQLSLTGETTMLRVFIDTQHVLGAERGAATHTLTPTGADTELKIEFGDYAVAGQLTIAARDAGGAVVHTTSIQLQAAPLIMNHHLQPAERVWVVSTTGNASMIASMKQFLGTSVTTISGATVDQDVWVQDEFELATTMGDANQRVDVTIDSIRDRGLQNYSATFRAPDSYTQSWGNPTFANTFDSFGNLEASPPVTVNGVSYPFGKIYYGHVPNEGLNATLGTFLAKQKVQAPFKLPSNWLCVGHVDEFSTFVPAPGSAKGFKLVITDTKSAYTMLAGLSAAATLPKYGADHGYATVGAILADTALKALNDDLQADYLDPIIATFKTQLGLTEDDIIRLPSLFEHVSGCSGRVAALIPGMANLLLAKVDGTTTHLFTADPFFRSTTNQATDPVITAFKNLMPAGMALHFVDDWSVYHLGLGEVHCGTNTKRTPTEKWWTAASHLMGGN